MPAIIEPPPDEDAASGPLWKRLAWFFGLALAGTFSVAVVAYGLRALLRVG